MANNTSKTQAANDAHLVQVLQQGAAHKVLSRLNELLPSIVEESVRDAIVEAANVKLPDDRVNGEVRRPKDGGKCDQVWRELDRLAARSKGTPSLSDILGVAEKKKWNLNNARVEYYQWRKAHGISGRVAPTKH